MTSWCDLWINVNIPLFGIASYGKCVGELTMVVLAVQYPVGLGTYAEVTPVP